LSVHYRTCHLSQFFISDRQDGWNAYGGTDIAYAAQQGIEVQYNYPR
jgi:hypothetical protein